MKHFLKFVLFTSVIVFHQVSFSQNSDLINVDRKKRGEILGFTAISYGTPAVANVQTTCFIDRIGFDINIPILFLFGLVIDEVTCSDLGSAMFSSSPGGIQGGIHLKLSNSDVSALSIGVMGGFSAYRPNPLFLKNINTYAYTGPCLQFVSDGLFMQVGYAFASGSNGIAFRFINYQVGISFRLN